MDGVFLHGTPETDERKTGYGQEKTGSKQFKFQNDHDKGIRKATVQRRL